MRNLELKVRCEDDAQYEWREGILRTRNVPYIERMKQLDTYFNVNTGRLKLREWWTGDALTIEVQGEPTGAALIAYSRPDLASSRISDCMVSQVIEPSVLKGILTQALGKLVVVEKVRTLYQHGATRIHFDAVKTLGRFIEIETFLDETSSLEEATREHQRVIALLELAPLALVASSYSDVLLQTLSQKLKS